MRKTALLGTMVLLICCSAHAQRHLRILWLGNSYICDNGAGLHLDQSLEIMINDAHDSGLTDFVVDTSALNCLWAMGLTSHYYDATSMDLVNSGNYTHVVLQGYIRTEDTASMHSSASSEIMSGAMIAEAARQAGAIPVVFCAHPRCDATPYMWEYVINAYKKLADTTGALFAPASIAWRNAIAADPTFDPYQDDCIHQNKYGIYLNAAAFYCTFTDTTVVGHPVTALGPSYTTESLDFMQQIVWATYDSVRMANPQAVASPPALTSAAQARLTIRRQPNGFVFHVGDNAIGGQLLVHSIDGRLVRREPVQSQVVHWKVGASGGLRSCGKLCVSAQDSKGAVVARGHFLIAD
ncbi:MAG: hypothetical protein GF331_04510 [Chitinivibrionales bacterium]|nr:hypothetical protein [Chitinivibrionales bacterium]